MKLEAISRVFIHPNPPKTHPSHLAVVRIPNGSHHGHCGLSWSLTLRVPGPGRPVARFLFVSASGPVRARRVNGRSPGRWTGTPAAAVCGGRRAVAGREWRATAWSTRWLRDAPGRRGAWRLRALKPGETSDRVQQATKNSMNMLEGASTVLVEIFDAC